MFEAVRRIDAEVRIASLGFATGGYVVPPCKVLPSLVGDSSMCGVLKSYVRSRSIASRSCCRRSSSGASVWAYDAAVGTSGRSRSNSAGSFAGVLAALRLDRIDHAFLARLNRLPRTVPVSVCAEDSRDGPGRSPSCCSAAGRGLRPLPLAPSGETGRLKSMSMISAGVRWSFACPVPHPPRAIGAVALLTAEYGGCHVLRFGLGRCARWRSGDGVERAVECADERCERWEETELLRDMFRETLFEPFRGESVALSRLPPL